MAKPRTVYVCQQCGAEYPKWMGRCQKCNEWNSLTETIVQPAKGAQGEHRAKSYLVSASAPQRLSLVTTEKHKRITVGVGEFDRVLGGGIVPGSLILIGGDPGVGKSTLLLQISAKLAQQNGPLLYVSGE